MPWKSAHPELPCHSTACARCAHLRTSLTASVICGRSVTEAVFALSRRPGGGELPEVRRGAAHWICLDYRIELDDNPEIDLTGMTAKLSSPIGYVGVVIAGTRCEPRSCSLFKLLIAVDQIRAKIRAVGTERRDSAGAGAQAEGQGGLTRPQRRVTVLPARATG